MSIGFNKIGGVNNVYKTENVKPKKEIQAASNVKAKKDDLQISGEAMDYQIASKAVKLVKELPDVREDIVGPLKEKVATGNYDVGGAEIAEKLLNRKFDKKA